MASQNNNEKFEPKTYKALSNFVKSLTRDPSLGSTIRYISIDEEELRFTPADQKIETVGSLVGKLICLTPRVRYLRIAGETFMMFDYKNFELLQNGSILSELDYFVFGGKRILQICLISILLSAPNIETLHFEFRSVYKSERSEELLRRIKNVIPLDKLKKLSLSGLATIELVTNGSMLPLSTLSKTEDLSFFEETFEDPPFYPKFFDAVGPNLKSLSLYTSRFTHDLTPIFKKLPVLETILFQDLPIAPSNLLPLLPSLQTLKLSTDYGLSEMITLYNVAPVPISLKNLEIQRFNLSVAFHLLPPLDTITFKECAHLKCILTALNDPLMNYTLKKGESINSKVKELHFGAKKFEQLEVDAIIKRCKELGIAVIFKPVLSMFAGMAGMEEMDEESFMLEMMMEMMEKEQRLRAEENGEDYDI